MRYIVLHAKIPFDSELGKLDADQVEQLAEMVKRQLETIGGTAEITTIDEPDTIPVTKHGPCDDPAPAEQPSTAEIEYIGEATGEPCQKIK